MLEAFFFTFLEGPMEWQYDRLFFFSFFPPCASAAGRSLFFPPFLWFRGRMLAAATTLFRIFFGGAGRLQAPPFLFFFSFLRIKTVLRPLFPLPPF